MGNRYTRSGIFALLVLGGVYFWRNRFRIQRFLESRGIELPFNITSTGTLSEGLRGAAAKISGKAEHVVEEQREAG